MADRIHPTQLSSGNQIASFMDSEKTSQLRKALADFHNSLYSCNCALWELFKRFEVVHYGSKGVPEAAETLKTTQENASSAWNRLEEIEKCNESQNLRACVEEWEQLYRLLDALGMLAEKIDWVLWKNIHDWLTGRKDLGHWKMETSERTRELLAHCQSLATEVGLRKSPKPLEISFSENASKHSGLPTFSVSFSKPYSVTGGCDGDNTVSVFTDVNLELSAATIPGFVSDHPAIQKAILEALQSLPEPVENESLKRELESMNDRETVILSAVSDVAVPTISVTAPE